MEAKACLNLVVLKTKGAEKSASGNTIHGHQHFKSKKSSKSITQYVAVQSVTVCGFPVTVHDTAGLSDTDMSEDEIRQIYEKVFKKCESGRCVFLLVINAERFIEEERKTVEKIEKLLKEQRLEKTWILFTNGEQLEKGNMTIKEFIDDSEPLKKFVQKYNQRYHVFNNKSEEHNEAQFKILLLKMIQTNLGLKASEGGRLLRRIPAIKSSASDQHHTADSLSSRRIVLLGKTGAGKSAAGNTILGQKVFISKMRMISVTSECSEAHATVSGRSVSVVDTPGFFDTQMKHEELAKEIAKSVYISSPGPHAFLIVFPVNMRFTDQEQQIADQVEMLFGEEVLKYSIILFTLGDMLEDEPVEDIIKDSPMLRHLVQQCGGRFHVFNNRDQNNREQVNDLLQKIDTMIEQNGGGHYSNEMFEDAQRFRQEEEERRQREEEERKQQKQRLEEIRRMLMLKAQLETEFDKFYKHYEHRFSFSAFVMSKLGNIGFGACIGGAIGGSIGALLGIIAGPAGVIGGATLGATAGASLGAAFSL